MGRRNNSEQTTMFCPVCHMLKGRTEKQDLRCRLCEPEFFPQPEKRIHRKKGDW